jgi:hypothetical protein
MNTMVSTAPEGARGIDANSPITADVAQAFLAAGFSFVVRYVPRTLRHTYDITAAEVETILSAGLGLMLVQHVAPEGWAPSASLGKAYGETAAREASAVGYPRGGVLWCDLEGVKLGTPAAMVVAYCSAWYTAVSAAGYEPGLYVGYGAGLTADGLVPREICPGCGRLRPVFELVDARGVDAHPGDYACGACRGKLHRTGAVTRAELAETLGAPADVVRRLRDADEGSGDATA